MAKINPTIRVLVVPCEIISLLFQIYQDYEPNFFLSNHKKFTEIPKRNIYTKLSMKKFF